MSDLLKVLTRESAVNSLPLDAMTAELKKQARCHVEVVNPQAHWHPILAIVHQHIDIDVSLFDDSVFDVLSSFLSTYNIPICFKIIEEVHSVLIILTPELILKRHPL